MITMTTMPRATAAWLLIPIEEAEPFAAKRRRERWANALKALGVVLLLAAIAS